MVVSICLSDASLEKEAGLNPGASSTVCFVDATIGCREGEAPVEVVPCTASPL